MKSPPRASGIYTTACPRNCYSTCSLKVEVQEGRLRRIESHPQNQATFEGPCLKGLSYVERVDSPDRILQPLLRKANSSSFQAVSWDRALQLLAEKLASAREEFGPQSVLYYSASGTKGLMNAVGLSFWRLFGGCTTTYGDLCWPAGLEATRLTLGENKHNAPWDLKNARLIVMWGKNPAETNIHQSVFIDRALRAGAKLVVIDPRRTETAERADLLIQPRPGSDGALALAVASILVQRGWIDRDFIARHVSGYEEFAERAKERRPGWAARVCGIPEEQVLRFAELLGKVKPAAINAGFGMQRYTNSGQTLRAMIALLAITGNIGKPGAGWIFADLQSHIFDEVKDPIAFYPPRRPDGVVRVGISTARLGKEMLALEDPPLRVAWVERGNPVTQNPDTSSVLRAFRSLDFRVVVEQFMTDTAQEADLILPAKSMFEQSDVINAYWHPYIQLKQKILEPPGEVKPESEIYWHLAHRLGIDEARIREVIPEPSDEGVQAYLRRRLAPFEGLSLEGLAEGPVLAPGHQEIAFADHVFSTPSGKIELASEQAGQLWGVDAVPDFRESVESIHTESAGGDQFPLYFMTPNTKNRIHSQFNNLKTILQFSPKPLLHLHPKDADARGIAAKDRVRVYNHRGSLELQAQLDSGLKPGCVMVTNGWWISQGGTVNFLSLGRETDMGHGAAFHDNRVQVEALSARR
jgi:anaerobic selenocysteine-containing dehydrogenase